MRCSSKHLAFSALTLIVLSGCNSKPEPKQAAASAPNTEDLLAPLSERLAKEAARAEKERIENGDAPAGNQDSAEPTVTEQVFTESGKKPWISADELPWSASFLQFIDGRRIGYTELKVLPPALPGSRRINVIRNDSVAFTRAGSSVRVQVTMDGLEINDGRMDSFTETTTNGEREIITTGRLSRGKLVLSTQMGETKKTESVDVEIGTWGLMGLQAVLMSDPMKPGEKREAKYYVHSLRTVVEAELTALQPEMTAMLDGSKVELLPIDVVQKASDENGLRSRNWVNDRGELQKTVSFSGMNISWFRSSKDVLDSIRDGYRVRGGKLIFALPVGGDTSNLGESSRRIVFSVDGTRADPTQILASQGHQRIQSLTARSCTLTTVSASADELPETDAPDDLEQYLSSSAAIDSENEAIAKTAAQWAIGESPVEKAASIVTKFAEEFEPLETILPEVRNSYQLTSSKKADTLEATRLVVAMLRSQGVPSRCVGGAVLQADTSQLRFAAWVEAWIGSKWIAWDPLTGKQIDARYLKFIDTPMASANPYQLALETIEQFENLEFSVVGSDPQSEAPQTDDQE